MKKPPIFFSFVMSVFNEQPAFLEEAVESILLQSYPHFELILVNDSPDNHELQRLIEQFSQDDSRVKVINNATNLGLGRSLNKGVAQAKGDYIVRLDGDDYCYPNRLEKLAEVINANPEVGVFYSRFEVIGASGGHLWYSQPVAKKSQHLNKIFRYKNIICHGSVAIKTVLLRKYHYQDIRICEDYELWLRLLKAKVIFQGLDEVLVALRIREESMTSSDYYFTFFATKYIWQQHHQQTPRAINQAELVQAYQAKQAQGIKYNQLMPLYFKQLQQLHNQKKLFLKGALAFVPLIWQEKKFADLLWRTLMASLWRRL